MLRFIKNLLFSEKKYDMYLCGPMRGYKDLNKQMFMWAVTKLRAKGFTVWNPSENKSYLESSYAKCMSADLNAIIGQCDKIVLLPGWRDSLGANTEVFVAFSCGKKVMELIPNEDNTDFNFDPFDCSSYTLPYKKGETHGFDPHLREFD